MTATAMIGREVRSLWGKTGVVVEWEPLTHSMCDALVEFSDGTKCWHASRELRPIGELAGIPLPSREEAIREADKRALVQLRQIRERLVDEWHRPWPGAEHGKAIVGSAIDGALEGITKGDSRG